MRVAYITDRGNTVVQTVQFNGFSDLFQNIQEKYQTDEYVIRWQI